MGPVSHPVSENVDGAPPCDLSLESGEELAARRAVFVECERIGRLGLGCAKERRELDQVDAVFAVIVLRIAAVPADPTVAVRGVPYGAHLRRIAGMTTQSGADEAFEASFAGVGIHASASLLPPWHLISESAVVASRTSILPVTTSAIRRTRNSFMSCSSRCAFAVTALEFFYSTVKVLKYQILLRQWWQMHYGP